MCAYLFTNTKVRVESNLYDDKLENLIHSIIDLAK